MGERYLGFDIKWIWKCKVCGKRKDMKTEDGNEEWAFCCNKAMQMLPVRKFFVEQDGVKIGGFNKDMRV